MFNVTPITANNVTHYQLWYIGVDGHASPVSLHSTETAAWQFGARVSGQPRLDTANNQQRRKCMLVIH